MTEIEGRGEIEATDTSVADFNRSLFTNTHNIYYMLTEHGK